MIVIASIDQPSTENLLQFDNILLLSAGKTLYYGPPSEIYRYLSSNGYGPSDMTSPAEFILKLADPDFASLEDLRFSRLDDLAHKWDTSSERKDLLSYIVQESQDLLKLPEQPHRRFQNPFCTQTRILLHRMFLV